MRNPKVMLLGGILALLVGVVVWRWVSGWGLITMDYTDVPLSKVLKKMEWQGGVKIATNADLATPVTVQFSRTPLADAIDTLAVRLDGDVRLAYIAAPDKKKISEVIAAFSTNAGPGDWTVYSGGFGGGGGGPMGVSDTIVDTRKVDWNVSDTGDKTLQALFQQGAAKTGALFATPKDWNPTLNRLPSGGKTGQVAASLVKSANGTISELYLITVRPPRPEGERNADNNNSGEGGPQRWESQRTALSPSRGNRGQGNPEWMAERMKNQIAQLPPEERAAAQKDFDEMRAFWESVRNLSEDERRAKIQEMMSRPEVQEKMEERMAARDAKRTPAQREKRMKQYLERKQAAKNGGQKPS